MSVLAPPALFTSDTKSITPPLDDTWAYLEDPHCRPWMAMVLNLNLWCDEVTRAVRFLLKNARF